MKRVGDPCPYCKRKLTQEFVDAQAMGRSDRVRKGLAEAKARGTRIGRPPTVDVNKIIELRKARYSYSRIAHDLEYSRGTIARICKKHGLSDIKSVVSPLREIRVDLDSNDGYRPWLFYAEGKA